jgi:hypothetical protein
MDYPRSISYAREMQYHILTLHMILGPGLIFITRIQIEPPGRDMNAAACIPWILNHQLHSALLRKRQVHVRSVCWVRHDVGQDIDALGRYTHQEHSVVQTIPILRYYQIDAVQIVGRKEVLHSDPRVDDESICIEPHKPEGPVTLWFRHLV